MRAHSPGMALGPAWVLGLQRSHFPGPGGTGQLCRTRFGQHASPHRNPIEPGPGAVNDRATTTRQRLGTAWFDDGVTGYPMQMRKRWKIVSTWLHRRARARALNDELAALDAPSRLDRLDRSAPGHDDDEWTEQRLLRLLDMVRREDSPKAG